MIGEEYTYILVDKSGNEIARKKLITPLINRGQQCTCEFKHEMVTGNFIEVDYETRTAKVLSQADMTQEEIQAWNRIANEGFTPSGKSKSVRLPKGK